ncbi:chromosomal replication initiator protein DnaA [Mycoplasmopsis columbinasalis]|uniref:Chromosomal replication initiator protein DnaA n=2 Tax=Mycoplasmopsis columbinasalis TaxID=114880 RepID=A0A449BA92_9BACT|nr:chromosomal replication initiator protein DnaA [Mycoplasmopsis columbinasalis]
MSVKNLIIEGDKTYPVVVIFGKPGFGKTHFLYALANEMLENEKSVSLFTPKYFSTEIQLLLQTNNQTKLKKIREKLISVDLLIFDDFQVFSDGNKRATIDFLFDVFDARINLKKHTMFATDRNIALFKNVFADNLFSRLRLAIEIELDKPTKKDIEKLIYFIIEQKNLDKSLWEQDAIDYVVAHQSDSIRSLIGAIDNANFKLLQRNNLFYREPETTISKDDIKEVYSELEKRKIENYTPENIILNACQYYKVQKKDVLGRKRRKDINNARHVAMYMIRKELDVPLQKIGTIFNKNHSSVIYVIEKMEKDIESEQSLFQEVINTINEQLLKNS